MAKYLGPLSSATTGVKRFYVDISNQLEVSEIITTLASIQCDNPLVGLASGAILSTNVTSRDSHTILAGEGVEFVASVSGAANFLAIITIDYATNMGNQNSTNTFLRVVENI